MQLSRERYGFWTAGAVSTGDSALIGVENVFGQQGGDERLAMSITETIKSGDSLSRHRPVEPSFIDDHFGGGKVAVRRHNRVGETIDMPSSSDECVGRSGQYRTGRSFAVAICLRRRVRGCSECASPSKSQSAPFGVFLELSDAQHRGQTKAVSLHVDIPTNWPSCSQLCAAGTVSWRS